LIPKGEIEVIHASSLSRLKLHPKLRRYHQLCRNFLIYLREKENLIIIIDGYDRDDDLVEMEKPFIHRWKPEYMRSRMAKFYLLDDWAKVNPLPLSMLTFTTYHDSAYAKRKTGRKYPIEDSWDLLKNGFWKASLLIRNKIRKGVPYFWVVEPQPESGYPHIHAGYFTEFTKDEQNRMKNHWANIVKAGDYKHGLDFAFDQNYQNGEVSSLRNYLMKYLAKTFVETIPHWSPEELVFNAIAWRKGYRFFGCSRDLSKAMQRPMKDKRGYTWMCSTLHRPDHGYEEDIIIGKKPDWVPIERKLVEVPEDFSF
jgi:hypothetical protein